MYVIHQKGLKGDRIGRGWDTIYFFTCIVVKNKFYYSHYAGKYTVP